MTSKEIKPAYCPNVPSGSQYTNVDRRNVICQFILLGNQSKVAAETGVSEATISEWKNNTDWWEPLFEEIRIEKGFEIRAGFGQILQKGIDNQLDRLDNGDIYLVKERNEDGDMVDVEKRKPISYRDLVVGTGIANDKLRVMDGQATTITKGTGEMDKILKTLEEIGRLSKEKVINP